MHSYFRSYISCFIKHCYFIIAVFLYISTSLAQELPPIQVFTPQQYGGDNQNWSISQSSNDKIYVANNKGLLEFDGAHWQLYRPPNNSILRSVKVVDETIYTGCYMEFGFWRENNFGQLEYTSLSKNITQNLIEDEQFWNIIHLDSYILFQSLDRIYIFNTKDESINTLEINNTILKTYKVSNGIYFQTSNGIYKIEDAKSKLITDDVLLINAIIVAIFEYDGNLVFLSQNNGFFELVDGNLSPLERLNNMLPEGLSVYSAIQLENGDFAIGTISNGFYQLNPNKDITYSINSSNGLSNNTILSVFEDSDNNIWLGLDNGINSINIHSPYKIFNDSKGALGTVYASIVFNDYLYLGTNQGLFYKPLSSNAEFQFFNNTQGQVWSLDLINDELFCGHNLGTFIIKGKVAEKISNIPGAWSLKPIEGNPNLILQGNYDGLNILEKYDSTWRHKNKIENFNISSRYFELYGANQIFVNHEYKGLFKIQVDPNFTNATSIEKMNVSQELKSGIVKYNNNLLYATQEGVFGYVPSNNEFKRDSIYSTFFNDDNYVSGVLKNDFSHNRLWAFSEENISYASQGNLSNLPIINKFSLPLAIRKSIAGYENIMNIQDEEYLIGTSTGYIIMNVNRFEDKQYTIKINSITSDHLYTSKAKYLNKNEPAQLDNKDNDIGFSFSTTEFDTHIETKYQYQLIGIYDQWSDCNDDSSVLFKNLSPGDYTFNVRGKMGENTLTNTATYSFTIKKPWYFSNIMIAFYIIGFLFLSNRIHIFYKKYYQQKERVLIKQNKKELELVELESQKQVIGLENERLQIDIENKNRELAISTMSLIKKNEFLSTLKKELAKGVQGDLNGIIKIIDKNLNDTDDWKLFEEAFNNADKDFLKKVKSKHALLTPNDLRLCAYLRLNLSSKEIAPLLNISHRSVEVKRYRLRKKMGLPHKMSLTNYFLEI